MGRYRPFDIVPYQPPMVVTILLWILAEALILACFGGLMLPAQSGILLIYVVLAPGRMPACTSDEQGTCMSVIFGRTY